MAREFTQITGQREPVAYASKKTKVPAEPFIIVGVVMNLVREEPIANHIGMIDTS